MLLIATGALWGTYTVMMRLIYSSEGPPLPPLFLAGIRHSFVAIYSVGLLAVRRSRHRARKDASTPWVTAEERNKAIKIAAELAVIGYTGNVFGVLYVTRC